MFENKLKYYFTCVLSPVLLFIFLFVPKPASGDVEIYKFPKNIGTLSFSGEILGRYEYRDWFDPKPGFDNQYGFFFQRRLSV